jgi:hypothetical protein
MTADFKTLKAGTLNIDHFKICPVTLEGTKAQFNAFPRYFFDDVSTDFSKSENVVLLTGEIECKKGGIPRLDTYKTNDSSRDFFYIAFDKTQPNCVALFDDLRKIDEYLDREINRNKNKNGVLRRRLKGDREEVNFEKLKYENMVRESQGPAEGTVTNTSYVPYERVKVQFARRYDPKLQPDELGELETKVFKGRDTVSPEKFQTPTEIETLFRYGCTAMYLLMIHKIWIQKSGDKRCSTSIKCLQIYVTNEAPKLVRNVDKYARSIFASYNSESDSVTKLDSASVAAVTAADVSPPPTPTKHTQPVKKKTISRDIRNIK